MRARTPLTSITVRVNLPPILVVHYIGFACRVVIADLRPRSPVHSGSRSADFGLPRGFHWALLYAVTQRAPHQSGVPISSSPVRWSVHQSRLLLSVGTSAVHHRLQESVAGCYQFRPLSPYHHRYTDKITSLLFMYIYIKLYTAIPDFNVIVRYDHIPLL